MTQTFVETRFVFVETPRRGVSTGASGASGVLRGTGGGVVRENQHDANNVTQ